MENWDIYTAAEHLGGTSSQWSSALSTAGKPPQSLNTLKRYFCCFHAGGRTGHRGVPHVSPTCSPAQGHRIHWAAVPCRAGWLQSIFLHIFPNLFLRTSGGKKLPCKLKALLFVWNNFKLLKRESQNDLQKNLPPHHTPATLPTEHTQLTGLDWELLDVMTVLRTCASGTPSPAGRNSTSGFQEKQFACLKLSTLTWNKHHLKHPYRIPAVKFSYNSYFSFYKQQTAFLPL